MTRPAGGEEQVSWVEPGVGPACPPPRGGRRRPPLSPFASLPANHRKRIHCSSTLARYDGQIRCFNGAPCRSTTLCEWMLRRRSPQSLLAPRRRAAAL